MKKLILILSLSVLASESIFSAKIYNSINKATITFCGSRSRIIVSYLKALGYTILSTPTQVASNTWSAYISVHSSIYKIYVYTSGSSILGHEDVPI